MPSDRVQELFYEAQQLEEIADSYGADPARYRVADQAWDRAFKAAEREGGAQLLEELAAAYGFSTPASREARQSLGLPDTHQGVPTYNPYKSARQEAPTCDFCTADGAATWRYPCEDFDNVTQLADPSGSGTYLTMQAELRGDWYACDPCRDLIEANRWPDVLERHAELTRARPLPDGTHVARTPAQESGERDVIGKVLEGFRDYRKPGPPEPVVEIERDDLGWDLDL